MFTNKRKKTYLEKSLDKLCETKIIESFEGAGLFLIPCIVIRSFSHDSPVIGVAR